MLPLPRRGVCELPGEPHAVDQDGLDRIVGEFDVAEVLQIRNDLPAKSAGVACSVVDDDVGGSDLDLLESVAGDEAGIAQFRDLRELVDGFLGGLAAVDGLLDGLFHGLAIGFGCVTGAPNGLAVDADHRELRAGRADRLEKFDGVLLGLGFRDVDALVGVVDVLVCHDVFSFCFVFGPNCESAKAIPSEQPHTLSRLSYF